MTESAWLAAHPYFQPMADLHAAVDAALCESAMPRAAVPDFADYADDFRAGVPLLQSAALGVDLVELDRIIGVLLDRLRSHALPEPLAQRCASTPIDAGLLRLLRWTVLAHYLAPVTHAFDRWRDEDHWLRSYCPTCGEPPAMAHLAGIEPGRLRRLSCGCCGTRWRFLRTGCPFCDEKNDDRLAVVAVDGESGLRIDYCEGCRGYLKTYNGEGNEAVLLADWTSLHLDVIAQDRGLKRLATSLYQF